MIWALLTVLVGAGVYFISEPFRFYKIGTLGLLIASVGAMVGFALFVALVLGL